MLWVRFQEFSKTLFSTFAQWWSRLLTFLKSTFLHSNTLYSNNFACIFRCYSRCFESFLRCFESPGPKHGAKALSLKMSPGRPFGQFRHFQRKSVYLTFFAFASAPILIKNLNFNQNSVAQHGANSEIVLFWK